jgi:hypothetical protein
MISTKQKKRTSNTVADSWLTVNTIATCETEEGRRGFETARNNDDTGSIRDRSAWERLDPKQERRGGRSAVRKTEVTANPSRFLLCCSSAFFCFFFELEFEFSNFETNSLKTKCRFVPKIKKIYESVSFSLKLQHLDFSGAVAPPVRPAIAAPVFIGMTEPALGWRRKSLGYDWEKERKERLWRRKNTCFITVKEKEPVFDPWSMGPKPLHAHNPSPIRFGLQAQLLAFLLLSALLFAHPCSVFAPPLCVVFMPKNSTKILVVFLRFLDNFLMYLARQKLITICEKYFSLALIPCANFCSSLDKNF